MVHSDKYDKCTVRDNSIFTRLWRSTYDIGIFGKKGSGKTMYMSYLGFCAQQEGYTIYSNYSLNYPHIRIRTMEDFNLIFKEDPVQKKILLLDDGERWLNSRVSSSKINKNINEIMLDFGKCNCSVYFCAKRVDIIDKSLRDGCCEFDFVELQLNTVTDNDELNEELVDILDFLRVKVIRINDDLEILDDIILSNLDLVGSLYNTIEKVEDIKNEDIFANLRYIYIKLKAKK